MDKNRLNERRNKLAVVNVNMPNELHHAFKIRCLIENKLMQDVACELITEYLREHKNNKD